MRHIVLKLQRSTAAIRFRRWDKSKGLTGGCLVSDLRQSHQKRFLEGILSSVCFTGGKSMYAKSLIFVALLAIGLLLPTVSQAQSARDMSSQASIDTANVPNGSIVVLSNEETSIPGYFHTR